MTINQENKTKAILVVLFASIGDEPQVLCITGKSTVSHVSKPQQLICFCLYFKMRSHYVGKASLKF